MSLLSFLFPNRKIFNSLCVSDLIWAKMPLTHNEKRRIVKSHQIRPYLVIQKNRKSILAIPATSNSFQKKKERNYVLSHYKYKLPGNKDSILLCTKIDTLKARNILRFLTKISTYDMKKIFKEVYILNEQKTYPFPFIVKQEYIEYETGDLILYDKCYLIYSIYKKDLYAYPVHRKGDEPRFKIGTHFYKIDYHHPTHLSSDKMYKIIGRATEEQLQFILKKKKECKKQSSLS